MVFAKFSGAVILVVAALLPILNPFGMAPIFFSMTQGLAEARIRALSLRVGLNAFILLAAAMFVGTHVLSFFGISLTAVRLGGGLVLMISGYQLLTSDNTSTTNPERNLASNPEALKSLAFYPLTFPLSVGPGSLSIAITLGANLNPDAADFFDAVAASLVGIAVVSLILYLCYRSAHSLSGLLGATGTVVLLRLSAFILLCIGVQILMNGATEFARSLPSRSRIP
jgi:multiple antibiotic resistance protein